VSAPPVRTVPELLRALLARDPGRPRLTWYGTDGERVELSARTLDNWVAKSANLLVEEFDAGPGTRIGVRLPAHWRTTTWLLATWVVGACAVVGNGPSDAPSDAPSDPPSDPPSEPPDVVVTADPATAVGSGLDPTALIGVALPPLVTSFGPGLPPGALDGAAEVRLRGDVFVPLVAPAPGDPALVVPGRQPLPHDELLPAAADAAREAGWPTGVRLLSSAGPDRAVEELLAPLLLDGSVVLHSPALDADALRRIADQEHVTR
jgi:uncharacterized protein (TIGR03089 family)